MANEKRLIDADALKSLFRDRYDRAFLQMHSREEREYWDGVCCGVNWGLNTITDADTVDAVELPCRPGDHVFRLCGTKKNRYVGERIVSAVTLCGNGSWTIHSTAADALGKTVFLTHEEAEAAIAKMDGDGNG